MHSGIGQAKNSNLNPTTLERRARVLPEVLRPAPEPAAKSFAETSEYDTKLLLGDATNRYGDEGGIVEKKWGKTFVHRKDPTGRLMTYFLLVVLFSIPALSLYIGYALTVNFAVPKRSYIQEAVALDPSALNLSHRFTHYLTAEFQGGLGNLMFQYAAVYGLAKGNGFIPIISKDIYINRVFPSLYTELSDKYHPGERWANFIERHPTLFDPRSFSLNFEKDVQLVGFFQSWKYFEHARNDIKEQFAFSAEVQSQALAFLSKSSSAQAGVDASKVTYIGIHVRRGDFLQPYNVEKGFTVATPDYIDRAMTHFANQYDNVVFIASSDDNYWLLKHVKSTPEMPVVYSHHDYDALDLCILSMCNHTIMTVGTFGWWAGYLAGGDTIYYGGFPEKGSMLHRTFMADEFYHPGWISM